MYESKKKHSLEKIRSKESGIFYNGRTNDRNRESGTTSQWDCIYGLKYCMIVSHGDMDKTTRKWLFTQEIRRGREGTLSAAKMTRKEDQVQVGEGLKGGGCELCEGLLCEDERQAASLVWVVLKIESRR